MPLQNPVFESKAAKGPNRLRQSAFRETYYATGWHGRWAKTGSGAHLELIFEFEMGVYPHFCPFVKM